MCEMANGIPTFITKLRKTRNKHFYANIKYRQNENGKSYRLHCRLVKNIQH